MKSRVRFTGRRKIGRGGKRADPSRLKPLILIDTSEEAAEKECWKYLRRQSVCEDLCRRYATRGLFPLRPSTPPAAAAYVLGCHVGRPQGGSGCGLFHRH